MSRAAIAAATEWHPAAHRLKALPPAGINRLVAGLRPGEAAGELHHETRIDTLGTGGDAIAAAAAHRGPANRLRITVAAGDQIDNAGGGFRRIRLAAHPEILNVPS